MQFVTNAYDHYFRVAKELTLNKAVMHGCTFYETELEMAQYIAEKQSLEVDDILGTVFELKRNDDGELIMVDDRGFWQPVNNKPDFFIASFQL